MTDWRRSSTTCLNLNHRRSDAPVAYCPQCGAVVNRAIRPAKCTEAQHADARRTHAIFCVHCGLRLITPR